MQECLMIVLAEAVHVRRRETSGDLNKLIVVHERAHRCVEQDLAVAGTADLKRKQAVCD